MGGVLPKFLSFWILLKSTFLAFKQVVQVVQIGGRGVGLEVIWTKSKRTATFVSLNLPYRKVSHKALIFKSVNIQILKKMVLVCKNISITSLLTTSPHPALPPAGGFKGRTCEGHKQAACFSWWHLGRTETWWSSYSGRQGQERVPKSIHRH